MTQGSAAGGSMAGYLWQVAEAARRSLQDTASGDISIEQQDDLAIASPDGSSLVCEQLKHSEDDGTISEASPIWWQAVRVWATQDDPAVTKRRLVTTDSVRSGSLLAQCYRPHTIRPWAVLETAMDETAASRPNKANFDAYDAWIGLHSADKRRILESVEILDHAPNLNQSIAALNSVLAQQYGVPEPSLAAVRNSFLGAFSAKVWNSLGSGGFKASIRDVRQLLLESAATTLQPGLYDFPDLPIDPTAFKELQTQKMTHVVPQLASIGIDDPAKVLGALEKWFQARAHRERIMNASIKGNADVKRHDDNLTSYCETAHDSHPECEGAAATEVGRSVYHSCMANAQPLGRTPPDLLFSQGSYYELSNDVTVRWHPHYPPQGAKP